MDHMGKIRRKLPPDRFQAAVAVQRRHAAHAVICKQNIRPRVNLPRDMGQIGITVKVKPVKCRGIRIHEKIKFTDILRLCQQGAQKYPVVRVVPEVRLLCFPVLFPIMSGHSA